MLDNIEDAEAFEAIPAADAAGLHTRLRGKVVAETAMLLLCVEPVTHLDERLCAQSAALISRLIPHARNEEVLIAICMEPGIAREHAVAHAILSRLGHPDRNVDDLLRQTIAPDPELGPERLPHRRLEQAWLARVWSVLEFAGCTESALIGESMLGRALDTLGACRFDLYAFTHAVMYATDLGVREVRLSRRTCDIVADGDAALAFSLDSNDFDLTAEILLQWPMLHLPWSAAATFAFTVLTTVQDRLGFLPGNSFDEARYAALAPEEGSRFALATSYHAAYVMGFLCAVALAPACAPPTSPIESVVASGAGEQLLALLDESKPRCWTKTYAALGERQRQAAAPLFLTMAIRRAKDEGNFPKLRDALRIALAHDLFDAPAPRQAALLLGRLRAFTEKDRRVTSSMRNQPG